jgi:heme/copper-type cytochrome/quinol oxidase subunit 2
MNRMLRIAAVSGAAAALGAAVPAIFGAWPQAVLADMPNCAEYPAACANYDHQSSTGIIVAAVIILAVVLIVGAVLTVIVVRRRRRPTWSPPPPGPPPPGPTQQR